MKKIIVLLGLILSSSAFAQISVDKVALKTTSLVKSRLFQIQTPEDEKVVLFVTYTVANETPPRIDTVSLFGQKGDEQQRVDLTQAFYFRNGAVLFSLGKKFQVVSKPLSDPQRDYLLQSYVPLEQ